MKIEQNNYLNHNNVWIRIYAFLSLISPIFFWISFCGSNIRLTFFTFYFMAYSIGGFFYLLMTHSDKKIKVIKDDI